MASKGTVKLWLSIQAVLTYITHNKAFSLCLYNTALLHGRARNVGMWLQAKLVEREFPRPGGFQLSLCLHLLFSVSVCSVSFSMLPTAVILPPASAILGGLVGFVHCRLARMWLLKGQMQGRPELGYMCIISSQTMFTG